MRTRGEPLPCAWVLRDRGMLAWLTCEMPSRSPAAAGARPAGAMASLLASLVAP